MATIADLLTAAFALHRAGRLPEAERLYEQIVRAEPMCGDAWHFLGVIKQQAGDLPRAAECYGRSIQCQPHDVAALNNFGNVLRELHQPEQAVIYYRRAADLNPQVAEVQNNLGAALRDRKVLEEAAVALRRALELKPDYFEALNNLGNVLKDLGALDEAIACYRQAVAMQPTNPMILDNWGLTCLEMGRLEDAAHCFQQSLALDPAAPHVHWCQALLLLLKGDLPRGWEEYEWRARCAEWQRTTRGYAARAVSAPVWDGSPLEGQTILVRCEQGFGDTLQFIRYVPLVQQRGGRVIVECQPGLNRLLADCGAEHVVSSDQELPAVDAQVRLLSLPATFRTTLQTIPGRVPYLRAEEALAGRWRERLAESVGTAHPTAAKEEQRPGDTARPTNEKSRSLMVGINWRGRQEPGGHLRRDMPLECFGRLANLPGVRLVSLQHGAGQQELAKVGGEAEVVFLGDNVDQPHEAFVNTAAIMMSLDLVITSDTAVAHLAGALGVNVWLGLPFAADWRWLLARKDSPWYPTMRLFRQKSAGDWKAVFQEMEAALAAKISSQAVQN